MVTEELSAQRQYFLDQRLEVAMSGLYKGCVSTCVDDSELSYVVTRMIHNMVDLMWLTLKESMPQQEAKATLKVVLDTVILDKGLHAAIDEFGMTS